MWENENFSLLEEKEIESYNKRVCFLFIAYAIIFVVIVLIFRAFCVSSVIVVGESMLNTVEDGDVLIVDHAAALERGEVVIFRDKQEPEKLYIKRIIAFGGETVWSKDGQVYVKYTDRYGEHTLKLNDEHAIGNTTSMSFGGGDIAAKAVPDGCLFVMGDNRENSGDTRGHLGYIEYSRVVGIVPEWVIENRNGFLGYFYQFF